MIDETIGVIGMSANIVNGKLKERGELTPDFFHIRKFNRVLVFVYDELMKNGNLSDAIKEGEFLGKSKTHSENFVLKTFGDDFPVIFTENAGSFDAGCIKGEVYAVSPETLLRLDYVKGNNSLCKRVQKPVCLIEQESPLKSKQEIVVQAYLYLGDPEYYSHMSLRKGDHFTIVSGTQRRVKTYYYDTHFMRDQFSGSKNRSLFDHWDSSHVY